jgi:5-methylcytosine-specific restriction endonuclease McrA
LAANPRYSNGARRRAARKWVLASQDICALCGKPVDKSLPAGHPMAPEVDEIIPVSRGGSPYERSNLQLAHRCCNNRKSNRMPGDATVHNLPIPTSRPW